MGNIAVLRAEYVDGLSLKVFFSDKTNRVIYFSDFLLRHPHPQYNKYQKPSLFKQFTIRCGNLIWGKHADLSFPVEALYAGDLELCEQVNLLTH